MLEILNNYPWTRLSVRIIGTIKRQSFHMVTHVFDNSNLSQEVFAIDTWGAVICSLGHGRKHMLTILANIWRPGFSWPCSYHRMEEFIIALVNYVVSFDDNFCLVLTNLCAYHCKKNKKQRLVLSRPIKVLCLCQEMR